MAASSFLLAGGAGELAAECPRKTQDSSHTTTHERGQARPYAAIRRATELQTAHALAARRPVHTSSVPAHARAARRICGRFRRHLRL